MSQSGQHKGAIFSRWRLTSDTTTVLGKTKRHPLLGILSDSIPQSGSHALLEEGQEFGYASVHTDIDRVRLVECLGVQDDSRNGTGRESGGPRRYCLACPLHKLDILLANVVFGNVQFAEDGRFDLLSALGGLDGRNKGSVKSVMGVEDGARVSAEQKKVVDQVEEDVSDDFSEVCVSNKVREKR